MYISKYETSASTTSHYALFGGASPIRFDAALPYVLPNDQCINDELGPPEVVTQGAAPTDSGPPLLRQFLNAFFLVGLYLLQLFFII
jgi:hypothetical protein